MTTLWTSEQKKAVDEFLDSLVQSCCTWINNKREFVERLDDRPEGSYDPSHPEVEYKMRYVAQGMLEDFIEKLQERV